MKPEKLSKYAHPRSGALYPVIGIVYFAQHIQAVSRKLLHVGTLFMLNLDFDVLTNPHH